MSLAYNVPPPPGGTVPPTYTSGGYSPEVMRETYCPDGICTEGWETGGNWQGEGTYAGFYQAPNGNYYPIGVGNAVTGNNGGGGGGPEDPGTGACTGVYGSCTTWSTCSLKCGGGTQIQYCFDTGCGNLQENTQSCNTQACGPWTKMKNSSYISRNSLTSMIALSPTAYDADDTTQNYFIVGAGGVVAAPSIDIDISNTNPTAKTSDPEYKLIYTPSTYSMTPTAYLEYIRARKQVQTVGSIDAITSSGTYVINGDVTVNSDTAPFDLPNNIVLVVTGTVTVDPSAGNTFAPTGSVAIIASTINFNPAVTQATGIFVAGSLDTGTTANQGLKIVGNLVSQTAIANNRQWSTTDKPSVFIKFDQTLYIDLLPHLGVARYEWTQQQ